jgi:sugar lactone lactonase YvrE
MSRRRFLRSFATVSAAALGAGAMGGGGALLTAGAVRAAEPVILGTGRYRYQVLESWGELPAGMTYGEAAAVCVDSKDNVYVFTRGAQPVIVFDRDGKFLRSWGQDIGFTNPHGASIGPDDLLYLTDDHGHTVRKCTLDGKLLMTIGTPKTPAPRFSGNPFNRCTHTALSPSGDIYVSDGYQNARVHKYSPDGKLLFSWGEPGTDPGQFNLVHNIACDDEGWVYVADRENHRVQVFDSGEAQLPRQWNNLARPCGLFVAEGKNPLAFIGELGPETVATLTQGVPNLGPRVRSFRPTARSCHHGALSPWAKGRVSSPSLRTASRGRLARRHLRRRGLRTYWTVLYGKKPSTSYAAFRSWSE